MLEVPKGWLLKVKVHEFSGVLRPKDFYEVCLIQDGPGITFSQYIHASPFLLRLRLRLALRRCLRMKRKFEHLSENFKIHWENGVQC